MQLDAFITEQQSPQSWCDPSTGLDCIAQVNYLGCWCGYVAVPQNHPFYNTGYAKWPNILVHGGLTFSGLINGSYYVGFDCCHITDYIPAYPTLSDKSLYKYLDFVKEQCSYLASGILQAAEKH